MFLKTLQSLQRKICTGVSFLITCRVKFFSKFTRKHLCWSLVLNKVTERKNSKNSQENICAGVLSLIKSQAEKITCAGGCRLKAQYQHQIVDAFAFFYFAVYNKIQAFCTIYAVCSYSSLKKVIWRVIVCILPISYLIRGGSRTAATSKMERFVIIVNGWKPLTIII